jgi:hypothetical protein
MDMALDLLTLREDSVREDTAEEPVGDITNDSRKFPKLELNSVALFRMRPSHVGEVSANFCG